MMEKWFTTSPEGVFLERRLYTLITSVFSHSTPLHLAFNCIAFISIAPMIVDVIGSERFVGFYLGAGILSGLIGHLLSVLVTWPVSHTACAIAFKTPSLGASGAVFALFAFSAMMFPDLRLSLIFLPTFTFSAKSGVAALVAFDTIGLIYSVFKQSPLGHGAHLGGVLCGYLYFEYLFRTDASFRARKTLRDQQVARRSRRE